MSESNVGRRPVARHGQLRSPSAFGQLMKIIGIAVAVVLVSSVGVAAAVLYDMTSDYIADSVEIEGQRDVPPDIAAFEGGFNLLLVGVDTCEDEIAEMFGDRCKGAAASGTLNDVNILMHVSDEPRKVTAISFPRDLLIPIPACTTQSGGRNGAMSAQPINVAWHHGGGNGLNCVVQTVQELSGMPIDFAAAVTFGGVMKITDAIGGVEICVENRIRDHHTGLDLGPGTHEVQGYWALQFLRTRHGVGDGSDLGRIGNQQQYMTNLVRKLVSEEVLTDPRTLLNLARTGLDNVTPSTTLTNPVLVGQIALVMKDVPFEDIVFVQYPVNGAPQDPNKVVPNHRLANEIWAALAENKSLAITHEPGKNDGIVFKEDGQEPIEAGEGEDPDATAAPREDVVQLSSGIRGNSAAQQTCSNGSSRG